MWDKNKFHIKRHHSITENVQKIENSSVNQILSCILSPNLVKSETNDGETRASFAAQQPARCKHR